MHLEITFQHFVVSITPFWHVGWRGCTVDELKFFPVNSTELDKLLPCLTQHAFSVGADTLNSRISIWYYSFIMLSFDKGNLPQYSLTFLPTNVAIISRKYNFPLVLFQVVAPYWPTGFAESTPDFVIFGPYPSN